MSSSVGRGDETGRSTGGGGRHESSSGGSFLISMVTCMLRTGETAVNLMAFESRLLKKSKKDEGKGEVSRVVSWAISLEAGRT